MSFILGEVGQLHFQHAHWNENVKRVVDRLKVKHKMEINNTLLQRETETFHNKTSKSQPVPDQKAGDLKHGL